jgi:hypothetical protein
MNREYGHIQLVGSRTGDPSLPVLPHDVAGVVDNDHPVIHAPIGHKTRGSSRGASAREQRETVRKALGIVEPDDRAGAGIAERRIPGAKAPHDRPGGRVDLHRPVVELIGNQQIARVIEAPLTGGGWDGENPDQKRHGGHGKKTGAH